MPKTTETEVEDEHVQFSCTVKYLDTFISSVSAFRDEGKLMFRSDNVFTKVSDPANVGMCMSKIEGRALNSLEVHDTDELVAALNFERILDCLSGVSGTSDVEVTWPVVGGGTRMIRLDIIDEDLQFEINTINTDSVADMPDVDPLSHKSRIVVDGTKMKKTIKHADKMVSEDDKGIFFQTHDEQLQIITTDKTSGNFKRQFHNHDPSVEEEMDEHETSISIQYLKDIKNILAKGDAVTVHVKDDHPIRFDIDLDDAGDAQVVYVIAPRLKSE